MALLDKCTGPACPHCGCQDAEIIRMPTGTGWWDGTGKAWCRHCGKFFHFRKRQRFANAEDQTSQPEQEETSTPPVEHQEPPPPSTRNGNPLKCPHCGGRGLVKSTRKGIQHRKCRDCGHNYKTEKIS